MSTILRNSKGHYLPGQSGNPYGKPKGFKGAAQMIRELTNDGADLIKFAHTVWLNENGVYTTQQQIDAHAWLADRLWGRAPQVIEAQIETHNVSIEGSIDLARLSVDQLTSLESLLTQATGGIAPVTQIIAHPGNNEPLELTAPTGNNVSGDESNSAS